MLALVEMPWSMWYSFQRRCWIVAASCESEAVQFRRYARVKPFEKAKTNLLRLEGGPALSLLLHLLVLLDLAVDALAAPVLLDALLGRLLELGRSLVVRVLEVERARDLVDELG